MSKARDAMLSGLLLQEADKKIVHWFNRFCRGMEPLCTVADASELAELLAVRDELRGESDPEPYPSRRELAEQFQEPGVQRWPAEVVEEGER